MLLEHHTQQVQGVRHACSTLQQVPGLQASRRAATAVQVQQVLVEAQKMPVLRALQSSSWPPRGSLPATQPAKDSRDGLQEKLQQWQG